MPLLRQLWVLCRPRGFVWVGVVPLVGYGIAHWSRALPLRAPGAMGLVFVAWLLLNAGTLWWNAALDQDEGPVLYGERATVPPHIRAWGSLALAGCVALAAWASPWAGACAGVCAGLAVAYSHPSTAWKARPLAGPLVNVAGYGLLSPLAGYALVGVPLDPRSAAMIAAIATSVFGAYLIAQTFQEAEDRARGYRTLVATRGPAAVIRVARGAFAAAHLGVFAFGALGWLPRATLLGLPAALVLDRWLRHAPTPPTERWARDVLTLALLVGALAVLGAGLTWIWQVAHGLPLAGLGTAAGAPAR